MPKIATKFVADVSVKVGRQSLSIKVPVDLSDLDAQDPVSPIIGSAKDRVDKEVKYVVVNAAALKRAHKTYRKTYP